MNMIECIQCSYNNYHYAYAVLNMFINCFWRLFLNRSLILIASIAQMLVDSATIDSFVFLSMLTLSASRSSGIRCMFCCRLQLLLLKEACRLCMLFVRWWCSTPLLWWLLDVSAATGSFCLYRLLTMLTLSASKSLWRFPSISLSSYDCCFEDPLLSRIEVCVSVMLSLVTDDTLQLLVAWGEVYPLSTAIIVFVCKVCS